MNQSIFHQFEDIFLSIFFQSLIIILYFYVYEWKRSFNEKKNKNFWEAQIKKQI